MKILQLCKKFPFPLRDGEAVAVTYLSQALHKLGTEITLLSMNTSKHYFHLDQLPDTFRHYSDIFTIDLDNQIRIKDAFYNLFSPESYHVSRFISDPFREKLIELLDSQHFDVVQLESLFLAPYIPVIRKHSNAVVVMRAHNVEHEIWERVGRTTSFFLKRWYLNILARKLRKYEIKQLNNYDLLVAITDRDAQIFRKLGFQKRLITIPVGLQLAQYRPNYQSFEHALSMAFIGSLDWMPNQDGLKWFIEQCWPRINYKFPKLSFYIAGRTAPAWVSKIDLENIFYSGEVENAAEFLLEHSVMVVPLLSGSGIRVKIIEGMALGRVIITTKVGLEGIGAEHKKEVLIANTPEEFVEAIQFCIENPQKIRIMAQKAACFSRKNFDSLNLAKTLLQHFEESKKKNSAPQTSLS